MTEKNNLPLVSCIIPVFNAQDYILSTLNSLSIQTYGQLEIIIVDDGSYDNSKALIENYKKSSSLNIQLFQNKGKGACAARNFGFEKSRGKYIQYLDADDLLSSDKIENQVSCLENLDGKSVASCNWGRFYGDQNSVVWEEQEINKSYAKPIDWLLDSWLGKGKGQTAIWLTPRVIINRAGKWNEALSINQDGEFFCRVLLNCESIQYCPHSKVYYRSENNQSISRANPFSRDKAQSLLSSYNLYKDHAIESGKLSDLKKGLGNNFLMFIYLFNGRFKDLSQISKEEFKSLGYKKMWCVGGSKFKFLCKLIGFNLALRISNFIK